MTNSGSQTDWPRYSLQPRTHARTHAAVKCALGVYTDRYESVCPASPAKAILLHTGFHAYIQGGTEQPHPHYGPVCVNRKWCRYILSAHITSPNTGRFLVDVPCRIYGTNFHQRLGI